MFLFIHKMLIELFPTTYDFIELGIPTVFGFISVTATIDIFTKIGLTIVSIFGILLKCYIMWKEHKMKIK